ncbi:MAG: hypothetical protein PHQ60_09160 [Sideroxydans sp.]|nr:hypothetical protein [Sideroxydans sp.]
MPSDDAADVSIRFEHIPTSCFPDGLHKGANLLGSGKVLLNIEEVAKYLIIDGKEVLIDPYPDVRAEYVRLFLLGSALGILLLQRGMLPLHGCGIVHNGKAILFLGDSGIGKSTLAEAFRRKGYKLITDDVSALCFADKSSVNVFPAYPKINLMEETAKNFDIKTEGLSEAHNKKKKFAVPVGESFCSDPNPLARIYILHRTLGSAIHLEQPAKIAAIPFLARNTYRRQIIKKMGHQQRHIEQCANLAKNYPVRLLTRPDDLSRLAELADYLESDFR